MIHVLLIETYPLVMLRSVALSCLLVLLPCFAVFRFVYLRFMFTSRHGKRVFHGFFSQGLTIRPDIVFNVTLITSLSTASFQAR